MPESGESTETPEPFGIPVKAIRMGCLLLALLPVSILVGIVVHPWLTGDLPLKQSPKVIQDSMIRGFSFDVKDPAGYWGKYSVSVDVKHERFDAVVFNKYPDHCRRRGAWVVVGMKGEKVVCFFVDSYGTDNLCINGKVFDWDYKASLHGPPEHELSAVAAGVTDDEIHDLGSLADLLTEDEVFDKLGRRAGYDIPVWYFPEFKKDILKIARQKAMDSRRNDVQEKSRQPDAMPIGR